MIITTALANEIVARAMAIIHHNVNVIDHHGQIIASGERHRIGEQHEIAREVIRTGKRICINNTAEAARFQNVHPGINHPIIYDDRVVMVVGISGDPAAISRYAELAVLTAELLGPPGRRDAGNQLATASGATPCFVSTLSREPRPPDRKRFIAWWSLASVLMRR